MLAASPATIPCVKGDTAMPSYLIQFSYAPETLAALVKKPSERGTAVNKLVQQIGGKLVGYWLSFGEYDGVIVVEGSDNVGAAACSMKVASSGAFKAFKTTPLLNPDEAVVAMKKADGLKYKPPGKK